MRTSLIGALLLLPLAAGPPAQGGKPLAGPALERALRQAAPGLTPAQPQRPRRLLLFTLTRGFFHEVIPKAARAFVIMGEKSGAYTATLSRDPLDFLPERLEHYDAVCFLNTTGAVFRSEKAVDYGNRVDQLGRIRASLEELVALEGKEVPPKMKPFLDRLLPDRADGPITKVEAALLRRQLARAGVEQERLRKLLAREDQEKRLLASLLAWLRAGGGFVGIHAATDTCKHLPAYLEMVGGCFDGHPWRAEMTVAIKLDEPDNPINAPFKGKGFTIQEEIYQFMDPFSRDRVRVLLSLRMQGAKEKLTGIRGKRGDRDYAVSWIRRYGRGRVFYCSLGHNLSTFLDRKVMRHYLAGIQFALGDLAVGGWPEEAKEKEAKEDKG